MAPYKAGARVAFILVGLAFWLAGGLGIKISIGSVKFDSLQAGAFCLGVALLLL